MAGGYIGVIDSGLTTWVCWDICNITVNTHPKYQLPESLAGEIQELAIAILEIEELEKGKQLRKADEKQVLRRSTQEDWPIFLLE